MPWKYWEWWQWLAFVGALALQSAALALPVAWLAVAAAACSRRR